MLYRISFRNLLFLLFFAFTLSYASQLISYVLYSVLTLRAYSVGLIQRWQESRQSHQELLRQVKELCTEHERLFVEAIALRSQVHDLSEIKPLHEYNKKYYAKGIIAQVLGQIQNNSEQTILINAGTRDGVTTDMIVVHNYCLLGKVTKVYPSYSHVALVTDPTCKVAAYCDHTKAKGVYEGNGSGGLLKFVSHLETVQEGDLVYSSGLGLLFPRGLLIGTIASYAKKELYYDMSITPACTPKTLSYCTVVSKADCA